MTPEAINEAIILNLGEVSIRFIDAEYERPESSSVYEDWGPMAPDAKGMEMRRWLIELTDSNGEVTPVGDMSAHAVWYGPTLGSKSMNIGISIVNDFRGKGIGSIAQRLLAEDLHREGIIRVEAGTDVINIPEQKSLLKAGFILEGTLRQAQGRADGLHDLQVWSHIN
jgi:RimJ/RimL family protein N-acetyltransferase